MLSEISLNDKAVGLQVQLNIECLEEVPEVQDIFLPHLRYAFQHRTRDIIEKKLEYAGQTN